MFRVEFSKWLEGSGIEYTETIDNITEWELETAEGYAEDFCKDEGDFVQIFDENDKLVEEYRKLGTYEDGVQNG